MSRVLLVGVMVGVCGLAAGRSFGDDPPAESGAPATTGAKGEADALRGPALGTAADRPERSIVDRNFQGRIKKLEDPPAVVALGKLRLSEEEKKKADKVVADRAAALDAIVRDNRKLIVEFAQAKQANDSEAINRLQSEVLQKASPFLKRGTLLNELKPALTQEHFTELARMVTEYNRAAADDRMGGPISGPKKDNRFGAMLAQGFEGFALEAKASYERVFGAGGKEFDALLKQLSLSPQQESRIRQKAGDLFLKTYGKPTKAQQIRLFLDVYAELDAAQRRRLSEYIGEENRVRRSAAKKS